MKLPWTLPTWRYENRRWSDLPNAGRFDRARRVAVALWPFVATWAGLAVAAAALFAIVNIADQRDEVVQTAQNAEVAAREGKAVALSTESLALDITELLDRQAPCNPGDPRESPGCVRQARTDAVIAGAVARLNEAIAAGVAAHDLNAHLDHEDLRRRLNVAPSPVARLPIPTLPATSTSAPPPTPPAPEAPLEPEPTTPEPTTTTTTCPRLPNGKCRP